MASKGDLEVGDECLQNLKSKISQEWKEVGRRLRVSEDDLHTLERERRIEGHGDVCYGMLLKWKKQGKERRTYRILADALEKAGRKDLEEDLLAGKFDGDTVSTDSTSKGSENSSTRAGNLEATGPSDKPSQKPPAPSPPAVSLPSYKMGNKPRGNCLILTYAEFSGSNVSDLPGNVANKGNLETTFRNLGFLVESYNNLDKNASMFFIERMVNRESDSFVLFVCSHGDEESFYTSDNEKIALQDVIKPFNADKSKGLFSKPKMFFFNTCRGGKKEEMAKAEDASLAETAGMGSNIAYYRPTQADFCVVLSTVPGFVSWAYGDSKLGSYFVRSLTDSLEKYHNEHHLLDILTMSNDNLLRQFEEMKKSSEEDQAGSVCQVPTIISTLTKAVYFVDK